MKSTQSVGYKSIPGSPGRLSHKKSNVIFLLQSSLFMISQGWGKWQGKAGGEGRGEGSKEEGQKMPLGKAMYSVLTQFIQGSFFGVNSW